jgi:hypothetical protein
LFNKNCTTNQKLQPETIRIKNLFHRTTNKEKTIRKLRTSYIKERTKQRANLNQEMNGLTTLLKENSIDQETYERLKKILTIGYEQKRQEIRVKHGFNTSQPSSSKASAMQF